MIRPPNPGLRWWELLLGGLCAATVMYALLWAFALVGAMIGAPQ
jgi:hypothetical protein